MLLDFWLASSLGLVFIYLCSLSTLCLLVAVAFLIVNGMPMVLLALFPGSLLTFVFDPFVPWVFSSAARSPLLVVLLLSCLCYPCILYFIFR